MANMTYILFICIAVPLLSMLILVHKREKRTVGFLLLGVALCLVASELNSLLLISFDYDYYYVTTSVTPLTEELLKSIPLLFFAAEFSHKRETLVTIAFAISVGFAIFENMTILTQSIQTVSIGWAILRGFASSLLHSICSVSVGFGLSVLFGQKNKRLYAPGFFALMAMAVTFHGLFNIYVQTSHLIIAFSIPLFVYIVVFILLIKARRAKEKNPLSSAEKAQ